VKIRWNCQITVEKPPTGRDPNFNTPSGDWEPLAYLPGSPQVPERFWAERQDVMPSRSEAVTQGLQVARNQTRIRLRWRDDIDSSMRITVHGETDTLFQIIGGPAEIGGRKAYMELMCERYSTAGGNG
jgi:head-tail adaptor